jgi:hypothetical protein
VETFSALAGLVLDPFSGSGSSLLAARTLGRSFIGIELDTGYHAITMRRLAEPVSWPPCHRIRNNKPPIPTLPSWERWKALQEQARVSLQTILDDMQSYFDDRSERWHESDKGVEFQERIDRSRSRRGDRVRVVDRQTIVSDDGTATSLLGATVAEAFRNKEKIPEVT